MIGDARPKGHKRSRSCASGPSPLTRSALIQGFKANRPSLQGSAFWMAPEVVKQTSYTSKADIWSVGCLVVEMLTGTHPWAELTQMQAIYRVRSDPLFMANLVFTLGSRDHACFFVLALALV